MALCVSSQPSSASNTAYSRSQRHSANQQLYPNASPPPSALGAPSRFYRPTLAQQTPPINALSEASYLQMQPRLPTWLPAEEQEELVGGDDLAEPQPGFRGTPSPFPQSSSWGGSPGGVSPPAAAPFGARGGGRLGVPVSGESVCPIPAVNWKQESSITEDVRRAIESEVCPIAPQDWRALSRTSSASASEHDTAASTVLSSAAFAASLAGSCGSSSPGSPSPAGSPLNRSPLHSGPLHSTSSCPLPAHLLTGVTGSAGSGGLNANSREPAGVTASAGSVVSGVLPAAGPLQASLREQLLRANSGSSPYQGPSAARPAMSRMAISCTNSRQSSGNFASYSHSYTSSPARDSVHDSDDSASTNGVNWQELDDLCQSMDAAGIKIEQIDLTPLEDDAAADDSCDSAMAAVPSRISRRFSESAAAPGAGDAAAVKYAVKFDGMSMWHSPSHQI